MINPAVHEARGVSEVDNQGEFGIGGRTRVARLGRVMAVRELTVSANDLATMEVPKRGKRLQVVGGGVVAGRDFTGLRWAAIELQDSMPGWARLLPVGARRPMADRWVITFEDCNFSGLRCMGFDPGPARFIRCRFDDVRVGFSPDALVHAHFVDCVFSGELHGNLSAQRNYRDPRGRAVISGNDFRRLAGASYMDGVDLETNRWDHGGEHLVVRRGGPGWPSVTARREEHEQLRWLVDNTKPGTRQSFGVFERQYTDLDLWAFLTYHVLAHAPGTPEPALLPRPAPVPLMQTHESREPTLDMDAFERGEVRLAPLTARVQVGPEMVDLQVDHAQLVELLSRTTGLDGAVLLEQELVPSDRLDRLRRASADDIARASDPWSAPNEKAPDTLGPWQQDLIEQELRTLQELLRRHPDEPLTILQP